MRAGFQTEDGCFFEDEASARKYEEQMAAVMMARFDLANIMARNDWNRDLVEQVICFLEEEASTVIRILQTFEESNKE